MFNTTLVKNIILMICGIFLAIWMGISIVTEQEETILKIALVTGFLLAALTGRRIWLLLIGCSSMNVMLYRFFGTVEIGQALFILFTVILFLTRKLKYRFHFGELEVWMLLIGACILQAYVRFPVGVSLLGSNIVGGRPYLILALGMVSALPLAMLRVPHNELKLAMKLSIVCSFLGIPMQLLRYGSINVFEEGARRIPSFSVIGITLSKWLASRISPLRACLSPSWAIVLIASIGFAAASGFRNSLAAVGLILFAALWYRSGLGSVLFSSVLGSFALALLALININFPLPPTVQRALSPFPGTWDEQIVQSAELSTDFRTEMWIEALTSEKWIRNKILGDGIGMAAQTLDTNINFADTKRIAASAGLTLQQESMLINGSYHSGPVHSIRMVGYVGLIVLILAMIRTAVHAHRQILRCRGTEWFGVALFFGIPQITHPIFFIFVFGEYHYGVAQTVYGMALIRLLQNNLPLPSYIPRRLRIPQLEPFGKKDRSWMRNKIYQT